MINGKIIGQRLTLTQPVIAADTINYLTAEFEFEGAEWDGAAIYACFAQGDRAFSVALDEEGTIPADEHLNLGAGTWEVSLVGEWMEDGEVTERLTTTVALLHVEASGVSDGEPFPAEGGSVGERVLAAANAAFAAADRAEAAAGSIPSLIAGKQDRPALVTAGTVLTLADNTEYVLSDVGSLTLSYPDGRFSSWLRITTAASGAISITLPTSRYLGAAPTFSNGETWEISVKDGVVAAGKVGDGT